MDVSVGKRSFAVVWDCSFCSITHCLTFFFCPEVEVLVTNLAGTRVSVFGEFISFSCEETFYCIPRETIISQLVTADVSKIQKRCSLAATATWTSSSRTSSVLRTEVAPPFFAITPRWDTARRNIVKPTYHEHWVRYRDHPCLRWHRVEAKPRRTSCFDAGQGRRSIPFKVDVIN